MTGLHNGALCAIITHTGIPIWRLQTGNTNRFHEQRIATSVSSVLSQLETKFQRLFLCFRGPAIQWCYSEYCTVQLEAGNQQWWPRNRKYPYLRFGGRHLGFQASGCILQYP